MSMLVINPQTERELTAFRAQPSHAVILSGPLGSGKLSLAQQLVENVLALPAGGLEGYAYKLQIRPIEGRAIGIEAVRELEHFLSLKVPGTKTLSRAVIIENSQLLTIEAQNALLKTLEEPPAGTIIVLTTAHEQSLLPTIRSRALHINVRRPDRRAIGMHFENQPDWERAYVVSGGLPGLMTALLTETDHPLTAATAIARQILSQTVYERLLMIDELAKQRQTTQNVLFILQNMAHISLQTAIGAAAKRWLSVLTAAYAAQAALEANAQPKLALTTLMLTL